MRIVAVAAGFLAGHAIQFSRNGLQAIHLGDGLFLPIDTRQVHDGVGVLLPLGDDDRPLSGHSIENLRQPIQHPMNTARVIDPTADTIRSTLKETLRLGASNLEQQLPILIGVGVVRNDPAPTAGTDRLRVLVEGAHSASNSLSPHSG